jgi:hypothetical protein
MFFQRVFIFQIFAIYFNHWDGHLQAMFNKWFWIGKMGFNTYLLINVCLISIINYCLGWIGVWVGLDGWVEWVSGLGSFLEH